MNGECERIRDRLEPYLLGVLEREEQAGVAAHTEVCTNCRAELEEIGGLMKTLDEALREPRLSQDFSARALFRIERTRRLRRWYLVAAAALVILLPLSMVVLRHLPPSAEEAAVTKREAPAGGGPAAPRVAAARQAAASKAVRRSMGYVVREAELIAVGDTEAAGPSGRQVQIRFQEILKGDASEAGKAFIVPAPNARSDGRFLTPGKTGIAVLLAPGWKKANSSPVLEVYEESSKIAVLREMVKIYSVASERERLVTLLSRSDQDAIFRTQLLEDLADMRDPANFNILMDAFTKLGSDGRVELMSLLGWIGDLRAVPLLTQAMESPKENLSLQAALGLARYFPGAPGVTEAFEKALHVDHLKQTAAAYLVKRRPTPEMNELLEARRTPWAMASGLLDAGDVEGAKKAFLAIVEGEGVSSASRLSAVEKILHHLDASEKERVREMILPLLEASVAGDNWLDRLQAARILEGLRGLDCLDLLIRLLSADSHTEERAAQVATFAILALGPEARRAAALAVVEMLKELRGPEASQKPRSPREEFRRDRFFVELAWLADEAAVKAVEELLTAEDQRSWKSVKPLFPSEAEPEERFLARLLEKPSALPLFVREWIVLRLGDLRAAAAVPLFEAIIADGLWSMEDTRAIEALVAIGGPEVEKASLELLDPDGRGQDRGARIAALEILSELRSPQLPSVCRRIIKEDPDNVAVARAINCLAGAGAEEDLGLLRSLADFWNEDKMVSRAAAEALADLRARLDCDLEGPISPR